MVSLFGRRSDRGEIRPGYSKITKRYPGSISLKAHIVLTFLLVFLFGNEPRQVDLRPVGDYMPEYRTEYFGGGEFLVEYMAKKVRHNITRINVLASL